MLIGCFVHVGRSGKTQTAGEKEGGGRKEEIGERRRKEGRGRRMKERGERSTKKKEDAVLLCS